MGNDANNLYRPQNGHAEAPMRGRASYTSGNESIHDLNQGYRESFVIRRSSSFYSNATYPNFEEFQERNEQLIPKTQGEKLDSVRIEKYPYNTVGFVAYQNTLKERNYSTGFLITSCLVLTAANPTLVRNEKNGTICEYRPSLFLLGQGVNMKIYEVIDFRRPAQFTQLMTGENAQDYLHSTIKSRITTLKKAETYDFCLLKLKENTPHIKYLNLLGDYDGDGENSIIGYNYEQQFDNMPEQDKEMVIGQYIYTNRYSCEQDKIRMKINVRKTVAGGPIVIKHDKKNVVIGILTRSSIHKELSAGTLINNPKIEAIRNWIIDMNQFPKCLVFRNRRGSHDGDLSQKDSSDDPSSEQQLQRSPSPIKGVKSSNLVQSFEEDDEFWSRDHFNSSKFEITNTRVKKTKYNGKIHQVVSKNPVNIERRSSCKVRVIHYGGKHAIGIGLINRNRIAKRYSGDKHQTESIGIWTFNYDKGKGRMLVDGKSVRSWDEALFVSQGSELIIKINKDDDSTEWWINQREVARYPLPECLRNQDLYLYVTMDRKQDCVEYIK